MSCAMNTGSLPGDYALTLPTATHLLTTLNIHFQTPRQGLTLKPCAPVQDR